MDVMGVGVGVGVTKRETHAYHTRTLFEVPTVLAHPLNLK